MIEAVAALRERRLSAVELLEACLRRRLGDVPQVTLAPGRTVVGLAGDATGSRVTGVRVDGAGSSERVIEADLVGSTVRRWAQGRVTWTGTASDLLDTMRVFADESSTRSRDWPNSPEALSNRLRRAATFLRKVGVEISFNREVDKQRSRTITILFSAPRKENEPSEPSAEGDLESVSDGSDGSFSPLGPGKTRI